MGYSDNLQAYVVDVYKYAIPETWTFTKLTNDQAQTF